METVMLQGSNIQKLKLTKVTRIDYTKLKLTPI